MSASPAGARPLLKAVGDGASRSIRHPLARALLALTFSTGLVDAVSYLGLGRVFTVNMTGNIVLLGFGIAGSEDLPVVAPLVSLGAFLAGSAIGGVLAVTTGDRHPSMSLARSGSRSGFSSVPRSWPRQPTSNRPRSPVTWSSRCSRWAWACATPP
jgi:hypothetical protein